MENEDMKYLIAILTVGLIAEALHIRALREEIKTLQTYVHAVAEVTNNSARALKDQTSINEKHNETLSNILALVQDCVTTRK